MAYPYDPRQQNPGYIPPAWANPQQQQWTNPQPNPTPHCHTRSHIRLGPSQRGRTG